MELQDTITILAPVDKVYAGLNDLAILKACIPGCEELVSIGEDELEAKLALKIGPMKARFSGKIKLDGSKAPSSFSLEGEGSGGVAGFAKGGATVELTPDGDNTTLSYTAKAQVGGKIAQLGGRLIDGTAKKLAGAFFTKFEKIMSGEETVEE